MIFRSFLALFSVVLLLGAGLAQAQQYRWIDKDGRVQFTDAPPPPWAKDVRRTNITPPKPAAPPMPFEVARANKDFPVTVYTSPNCAEICETVRGALNKRGVPFKEVQVWEQDSNNELKRVTGGSDVPALVVGRSVHKGFQQDAFDALLDSARYPRAGILPARNQAAPKPPEDYVAPGERQAPRAEPAKPEPAQETAPAGPYAPRPPAAKK